MKSGTDVPVTLRHNTELGFRLQVRLAPLTKDEIRNRRSATVNTCPSSPTSPFAPSPPPKVLTGPRAVFADQGVDAQMDDVARRADVGVGTVYRHFPTKEALLTALTNELFAVVAAHARELLTLDDPWEAFTQAMWFAGGEDRGRSGLQRDPLRLLPPRSEHLSRQGGPDGHGRRDDAAMHRDGPDAPRRDDRGHPAADVRCRTARARSSTRDPTPWRRHLGIVLDGLRARGARRWPRYVSVGA